MMYVTIYGKGINAFGTYQGNYYHGKPAFVEHPYGKGKVLYFGAVFTRENAKAILAYTNMLSPYQDVICLPEECELSVRRKDNRTFLFVLNYAHKEVQIRLKKPMMDLKTGFRAEGMMNLKAYEAKVFEMHVN